MGDVDVSGIENMVRDYAVQTMQCAADSFVEMARGLAPLASGNLAGSIEHDGVQDTGTGATATVTVGAEYAIYVEGGRGGESGLLALGDRRRRRDRRERRPGGSSTVLWPDCRRVGFDHRGVRVMELRSTGSLELRDAEQRILRGVVVPYDVAHQGRRVHGELSAWGVRGHRPGAGAAARQPSAR